MRVSLLLDAGARPYDVACAAEVFADRSRYGLPRTEFVVAASQEIVDLGRVLIRADAELDAAAHADLVIVPGRQEPDLPVDDAVMRALGAAGDSGSTIAGLCTGAFALAAAGLLDGQECTTHWRWCGRLAQRYPWARVVPNVLYAGAGAVWTSAGVSAGTDLLLELIRQRLGAAVAAEIARSMVTPAHRPGGQAQFVPPVRTARPGDLEQLQVAVLADLRRPWTLAAMSAHVKLAERTLSRRFLAQTGRTPVGWLTDVRLAAAQELLETTDVGVEAIAHDVGFGSADLLRKHFRARYGTSPQAHRAAMGAPNAVASRDQPPTPQAASG